MKRRTSVTVLVGLVIAMAYISAPAGAQSEEERLSEVEREIRDLQALIDDAEAEASEYAAQLAETQARMDELLEILGEAQAALDAAQGRVDAKEADVAALQRAVAILQAEIAETQLEQRSTRTLIRERAVELYMSGSSGIEGAFFSGDDLEESLISVEYAGNLVQETAILLRSLEVLENQEATQQALVLEEQAREEEVLAALEIDRAEAETHKVAVDATRAEVQEELDAQQALLDEINAVIAEHESHVDRLERESRELELEIARRQVREGSAPGRLAYPVPGPITSPYGWRIHPIFGTRKLHTGIDMNASHGQNIRAAGNGVVIMATTWGGYGRTVIIDHGGGLSTLYAHQSSILVSLGESVEAGDVIGRAGCTGYCTGTHLHFETREFGTPVDPLKYLNG